MNSNAAAHIIFIGSPERSAQLAFGLTDHPRLASETKVISSLFPSTVDDLRNALLAFEKDGSEVHIVVEHEVDYRERDERIVELRREINSLEEKGATDFTIHRVSTDERVSTAVEGIYQVLYEGSDLRDHELDICGYNPHPERF